MPTYLDFETRSEIDLKECGVYKYATDVSTDIVCLAYKIDDGATQLWTPSCKTSPQVKPPIYAHNAYFDYMIWSAVGVDRYNFPAPILDEWIDVAAIAAYYALPRSLAQLGEALSLKVQKNPRGKALMRKISMPPFKYSPEELKEYYDYCIRDVDAMVDVIRNLPAESLSEKEQSLWLLTCKLNMRGLPIDVQTLHTVRRRIEEAKPSVNHMLADISQGQVTKATQVKRIKDYVNYLGWDIPNLQEQTINEYLLANPHMDLVSKTLLQTRLDYGGAAISKLKRMQAMLKNGRVYDYLVYYVASTGRWAGAGIQPQNFPRAESEDVEHVIANVATIPEITKVAKTLIRPIICAKPGYTLVSVDYSAIEYIVAVYLVGDKQHKALYDNKEDQYIDMATALYSTTRDGVTKEQRMFGKVTVLQCQYQAGVDGFLKSAKSWGLSIDDREGERIIRKYRETYHLTVEAWWALADLAMMSVKHPNTPYYCKQCFNVKMFTGFDRNHRLWFTISLPSGRKLYYGKPEIKRVKIKVRKTTAEMTQSITKSKYKYIEKDVVSHLGINSVTKKWERKGLSPGRIFENIVQATARDILAEAHLKLENYRSFHPLCSVHDEIIVETKENRGELTLKEISRVMCEPIDYLPGLKMRVSGWCGERYRK